MLLLNFPRISIQHDPIMFAVANKSQRANKLSRNELAAFNRLNISIVKG